MMEKFHVFHMLEKSPWPLIGSTVFLLATSGGVCWFHTQNFKLMILTVIGFSLAALAWWKDMSKEGVNTGSHSMNINSNLQIGMILFISSEVMFFSAFFWAFFHSSVSPTIELGQSWPPSMIFPFDPMNVPLLNTLILLSSGVSVTYSHHALLESKKQNSMNGISLTLMLGVLFTIFQGLEYMEAPYSMADSIFGTTFFVTTGFHGLHVIIGSTFLFITLLRMQNTLTSKTHTTGFECAAWYWHFVDVVWLFLYSFMYWWGS